MVLTVAAIRAAKAKSTRYKLADGGGLHLLVLPSGSKSWRWRYQMGGVEHVVTLGAWPDLSVTDARRARDQARASRLAPAATPSRTLADVTADWLAAQTPLWKPHHAADVKASLDREILPSLGDRPLATITAPNLLVALRPIQDRGAIELAHRLRQRLAGVWMYAIAAGEATANPAAGLEAALKPVVRQGRQPAVVTIDDARAVLAAAESIPAHPVTRLGMRLLALTALRPGELRGGRWQEIEGLDGTEPVWRVPAARMKHIQARAAVTSDHVVPLSRQAVEALLVLRTVAPSDLLFPSWSAIRRPMSENALIYLLQRAGLGGVQVPHGWRATFSTVMNELYPADRAVIDLMLAHTPPGAVEAAYNRAQHVTRRRELAQAWADLLLTSACPVAELASGPRKTR